MTQIQFFQSMSEQSKNKRKNYKQISEEVRQQIIDSILNQDQDIKEVSNRFGVNISTCKAIIKVYQKQGRIGKKKNRNKVHNVIQTFSFFMVNQNQIQQQSGIHLQQSKISLQRNEELDQHLQAISKVKSEKILDTILQEKKKLEEAAYEANNQFTQYFLNPINWMQFQSTLPILPINQLQVIKQQVEDLGQGAQLNNKQSSLSSKQLKEQ